MVSRAYLGRTLRKPERSLEIRIYEDLTTKLPMKFAVDLYQDAVRSAGGLLANAGDPDGKKKPYIQTEIVLSDVGTAKAEPLDAAARKLLERK